jgi:3-deoxy-D-manno-octulosonic-acid transferase
MVLLYDLSIRLLKIGIQVAGVFHPKAKAFVTGRKGVFEKLNSRFAHNSSPVIWVHCASLGEFEQARPLIEAVKNEYPSFKVLLTFFSPSGYEIRKDYRYADEVAYLPMDTNSNAQRFISIVKPAIAIFVKYEFWYHYSKVLKAKNIPALSTSSIFRKDQMFFKGVGNFYRKILQNFSHFFVQNDDSLRLLQSIGITNVSISGDTRFDRVHQIVQHAEPIPIAERFKGGEHVFVVGSSWEEDMEVLTPFINENKLKFIIAPHEISDTSITALENSLTVKSVRYSEAADKNLEDYSVLIIDNIGLLSRLYRYGEFAFIGGAYGKGLHNILEAACYGIPILFGNKNYLKFQEAVDLINRGGAFDIKDYPDLKAKYEMLNVPSSFLLACDVTRQYVDENLGATEKIMSFCRPILARYSTVVKAQS